MEPEQLQRLSDWLEEEVEVEGQFGDGPKKVRRLDRLAELVDVNRHGGSVAVVIPGNSAYGRDGLTAREKYELHDYSVFLSGAETMMPGVQAEVGERVSRVINARVDSRERGEVADE